MLERLKRHPFPVVAHLRRALTLTYACPADALAPLLPPGLALDTHGQWGFLAIALVQTEGLRPAFLPPIFGRDFFLSGFRIFTRFGQSLRGLYILRSHTDSRMMCALGDLLTHYNYGLCTAKLVEAAGTLRWTMRTLRGEADLDVSARLDGAPAALPASSPFRDQMAARRFAGPLPFTFDYEAKTNSIVRIQGLRDHWQPKPLAVDVHQNTFLEHEPFRSMKPVLANAFYISDLPYRWAKGVRVPLGAI